MATTVEEVLREARSLVETTHWTKGAYWTTHADVYGDGGDDDDKEMMCLTGMVNDICGVESDTQSTSYRGDDDSGYYDTDSLALRHKALLALERAIRRFSRRALDIEFWNDAKTRNREQVLRLIDDALAHPEEE